ncbi:hypothetical protein [Bosea sp. UNC402CLCol]|uniref:hypothetical protein n=1 Tax=Bosea sp. UNC402CLCol TaxID=1510531 RepID=UPI00056EB050|nr:hypothetical protein [Bosea sp. UNC402CLCol]
MKPITITFGTSSAGARYFDVEQGGKVCDGLAWDEMLGQVVTLTLQAQPGGRAYPMKTPAEWQAERERRAVAAARREHEAEWDAA